MCECTKVIEFNDNEKRLWATKSYLTIFISSNRSSNSSSNSNNSNNSSKGYSKKNNIITIPNLQIIIHNCNETGNKIIIASTFFHAESPPKSSVTMNYNIFKESYDHDRFLDADRLISKPFDYLTRRTYGKDKRRFFISKLNTFYNISSTNLSILNDLINQLHISSLIIDDVEDNSKLRRGKPCAHLIFGTPTSINCSNFHCFTAFRYLKDLFGEDLIALNEANKILIKEMINLHRGQGLDLYWRDNYLVPNEEEYFWMVMNKTGGLFRLSVKLMSLISTRNIGADGETKAEDLVQLDKLVEFCNLMGVIYQIRDDYLNLTDSKYNEKKGFAEDITEGKCSFPVVHVFNSGYTSDDDKLELKNILKLRTEDVNLKKFCLEIINRNEGLEYCRDKIISFRQHGATLIQAFEMDASHKEMFMELLNDICAI